MKSKKEKKKKDNTGKIIGGLTLLSFIFVTVVIGQFLIIDNVSSNTVGRNTVINGYNISGMSKDTAVEYLTEVFEEKSKNFNLKLTYKDNEYCYTSDDFELNTDIHTILDVAEQRNADIAQFNDATTLINQFTKNGSNINVAVNYLFIGLDDKIDEIANEIEIDAINSEIIIHKESANFFEITESSNGIKIDKNQLYTSINNAFLKSNDICIEIPTINVDAEITKNENEKYTCKIAEFSTNVADSTGGRKINVNTALNYFNGFVIEPDIEYSFNKVTGPHTQSNGYKNATIIYNGKFVEGVGGGICQASTTLYNALLKAGVEITEVNKHSLPVKYVPLGLDAMVAEYISDLKFINTTSAPMFVRTTHTSNDVTVEIFSQAITDGKIFQTRCETIQNLKHAGDTIIPDTNLEYQNKVLFKGEYFRLSYPIDGFEVKTYLQTLQDGKLLEEKEIRHEIYQPQNGIIIEGVQDAPTGMTPIDSGVKIITVNE